MSKSGSATTTTSTIKVRPPIAARERGPGPANYTLPNKKSLSYSIGLSKIFFYHLHKTYLKLENLPSLRQIDFYKLIQLNLTMLVPQL